MLTSANDARNDEMKMTMNRLCPKCGNKIEPKRGRPARWCGDGCRRSGEDELTRLQSLLRAFEQGRAVDRLNGHDTKKRDQVIAELQARFDHLCGVPGKRNDDDLE